MPTTIMHGTARLEISDRDTATLLCALYAVSPTGGGSDPFNLACRIAGMLGTTESGVAVNALVASGIGAMQITAAEELPRDIIALIAERAK